MDGFLSDAETLYEPDTDADSLLSDDITFRTANSRQGRYSSLEESGYQSAGRAPSPSPYAWYPEKWRRMANNASSASEVSTYVPDPPTAKDISNSLAARRIHEEYFRRPSIFSTPPQGQVADSPYLAPVGYGADARRQASGTCSNGSPVGTQCSSAMQSAVSLALNSGRTSRSGYSPADIEKLAADWSSKPFIVGMATTPDYSKLVGPTDFQNSSNGLPVDDDAPPEDQPKPETAEKNDHDSLYDASDAESTKDWMCVTDSDQDTTTQEEKDRKRQGQGSRQFPPRPRSGASSIKTEWQRPTGFRYLAAYKDIRVLDRPAWGCAMTVGSLVICVGDTLAQEWSDAFKMQAGDVYVILQMFGDMWASCIKVSATEPLELGDSLENPRKDKYWVFPQKRVGFLPLASLTIAANFGDYMARHPRTVGHKVFGDRSLKYIESTPAGGRTVIAPTRTFSRHAAMLLENGGSIMVPPRVLDTCAVYRIKRSRPYIAVPMDETDEYGSFGHVFVPQPPVKTVEVSWGVPHWREMLKPIEIDKVNKSMPITNIAVELAAQVSRAGDPRKSNTPDTPASKSNVESSSAHQKTSATQASQSNIGFSSKKQKTSATQASESNMGSSSKQQDTPAMQASASQPNVGSNSILQDVPAIRVSQFEFGSTRTVTPAVQASKSTIDSSILMEDKSTTSFPKLEQETSATSAIDFPRPSTHEYGTVRPKPATENTTRNSLINRISVKSQKSKTGSADSDTHSDKQTATKESDERQAEDHASTEIEGADSNPLNQRSLRKRFSVRLPSRHARRNTSSSGPASQAFSSESRFDESANLSQSMTISRGSAYNRIHKAFKGSGLGKHPRHENSSDQTEDSARVSNTSEPTIGGEENIEPTPSESRRTVRSWRQMFNFATPQPSVPLPPTAQLPTPQPSSFQPPSSQPPSPHTPAPQQ